MGNRRWQRQKAQRRAEVQRRPVHPRVGGGLRWAMLTSYKHHITQLLKVVQRRPVHPRVRVVCDCDSFSFQQYLLQYQEQALGLCCATDTDFCRS